jgi:hypothetical protein
MTILLLNTNPIVHKLVSLSAQKTGDILHCVTSLHETTQTHYDLMIVDDARYSDDMMLGCLFTYNTALFLAMRGNIVPTWFDYIIYKPFLPTDLVDTFLSIQGAVSHSISENVGSVFNTEDVQELQELLDEEDLFFGDEVAEVLNSSTFNPFDGMASYAELDALSEEELKNVIEGSQTSSNGIEALQALLHALSSDDVAKTLKGLDINININFGNTL